MAGAVLGELDPLTVAGENSAKPPALASRSIPPHRPLPLAGMHVYTDRTSYAAGDMLTVYTSAAEPCTLEVVRLGESMDDPAGDEVLHTLALDRPCVQPIHPGSYIHVEHALPAEACKALTVECWLRLWNVHEPQGVITQLNDRDGFGLLVFPDGTLGLFTGECDDPAATPHRTQAQLTLPGPSSFSPYIVPPANWHHVVAIVEPGRKSIWLDGRRVGEWKHAGGAVPGRSPLRIGALGRGGQAAGLLDADIAMPAVYRRALSEIEFRTRHAQRALVPPECEPDLLACWPLTEERGELIADLSAHERSGRIVNHATWMIGGPSFLPAIARYRRDYVPARDASRGHGLRLASDDLYDCRWEPTLQFELPKDSRSGLYAVRGRFKQAGKEVMTHAVFVVRPPAGAKPSPIALLFATNTWKAYSGAPFGPAWPDVLANVGIRGFQSKPNDPLAAYCFYRYHRAGQPAYQLGWRLPWPAASPYAIYSAPEVGYSHLSRADRFMQRWLEQNGYAYDALTDHDLHRDQVALGGAKVLVIVGHSEYWTHEAMQRVRQFLDRGGKVVCLSGNTMFWRVTQNDNGAIVECRKADAWGAQLADYMRGECWHEHDQQRGGGMRECGDPEWRTLGVDFTSAAPMTTDTTGAFHVVDDSHPFFHFPSETNLERGDRFGFDPHQPSRHLIGHEADVRVSTLMEFTRRLPPLVGLATNVHDSADIRLLAVGRLNSKNGSAALRDYACRVLPSNLRRPDDSLCDMIHWKRPAGGEVFCAPSIAAAWTLEVCPRWAALLKNVLHHFGVKVAETG